MTRTIKVEGKAKLNISPDQTTLRLELSNLFSEYQEALYSSNEDTRKLRHALNYFGIKEEDIKTVKYSIETEYSLYKDDLEKIFKEELLYKKMNNN